MDKITKFATFIVQFTRKLNFNNFQIVDRNIVRINGIFIKFLKPLLNDDIAGRKIVAVGQNLERDVENNYLRRMNKIQNLQKYINEEFFFYDIKIKTWRIKMIQKEKIKIISKTL